MDNKKINLKVLTSEEARSLGKKGGIKSGVIRRFKRDLQKLTLTLLEKKVSMKDLKSKIDKLHFKGLNNAEALILAMINKAINGDTQAAIFIRDISGQNPLEKKVNQSTEKIEDILRSEKMKTNIKKENRK